MDPTSCFFLLHWLKRKKTFRKVTAHRQGAVNLSDNRQEVNGRAALDTREDRGATHDLPGQGAWPVRGDQRRVAARGWGQWREETTRKEKKNGTVRLCNTSWLPVRCDISQQYPRKLCIKRSQDFLLIVFALRIIFL
jgi:hypothetical protein